MERLTLDFTVEPFVEGTMGEHVKAAIEAVEHGGRAATVGPFGTTVEGDLEEMVSAIGELLRAAFDHGAEGVAFSLRRRPALSADQMEFLGAVRAVSRALGGAVVDLDERRPDDVPVVWRGELVAAVRPVQARADLQHALHTLLDQVEAELGGPLHELSREDKQRAARLLEERGAFTLRNAVEDVADALGVSRVTVYNYLNAVKNRSRRG